MYNERCKWGFVGEEIRDFRGLVGEEIRDFKDHDLIIRPCKVTSILMDKFHDCKVESICLERISGQRLLYSFIVMYAVLEG